MIYGGPGRDYFQQLLPLGNESFLALGSKTEGKSRVWLVKINESGEVVWEKTYGWSGSSDFHGHRMTKLADGNFMIVGEMHTDASFNNRFGLSIKVDTAGIVLAQYSYDNVHALFDVIEQDGELIFLGWFDNTGSSNSGVIMRADPDGSQSWIKLFQVQHFHPGMQQY